LCFNSVFEIQDKEKDKKRKLMLAKLFKGRKKVKWNGLSGKQEQKLIDLIHSNLGDCADDDVNLTTSTSRLQPCPSSLSLEASSSESSTLKGDVSRLETSIEDMSGVIGHPGSLLTPELARC
jgi:hypothetical protein